MILVGDGQTYERSVITDWIVRQQRENHGSFLSPMTGQMISSEEMSVLVPNFALRHVIEELHGQQSQQPQQRLPFTTPPRGPKPSTTQSHLRANASSFISPSNSSKLTRNDQKQIPRGTEITAWLMALKIRKSEAERYAAGLEALGFDDASDLVALEAPYLDEIVGMKKFHAKKIMAKVESMFLARV